MKELKKNISTGQVVQQQLKKELAENMIANQEELKAGNMAKEILYSQEEMKTIAGKIAANKEDTTKKLKYDISAGPEVVKKDLESVKRVIREVNYYGKQNR